MISLVVLTLLSPVALAMHLDYRRDATWKRDQEKLKSSAISLLNEIDDFLGTHILEVEIQTVVHGNNSQRNSVISALLGAREMNSQKINKILHGEEGRHLTPRKLEEMRLDWGQLKKACSVEFQLPILGKILEGK